jgi:hypothetical protein
MASWHDRSVSTWAVYGRLKPGVGLTQARADLGMLFERSKMGMPRPFRTGTQVVIEPLQQHRVGNARVLLSVLIGAVTCLLLIACVNVSNLLVARLSARSGEFAIRAAVGAGRVRLARQLLTEAALLTLAGCTLGMLFAFICAPRVRSLRRQRTTAHERGGRRWPGIHNWAFCDSLHDAYLWRVTFVRLDGSIYNGCFSGPNAWAL